MDHFLRIYLNCLRGIRHENQKLSWGRPEENSGWGNVKKGVIPVYCESDNQQIARTGIAGRGRLMKDRR